MSHLDYLIIFLSKDSVRSEMVIIEIEIRNGWRTSVYVQREERMLRFPFGDDMFISYSRKDGANYAVALASELSKKLPGLKLSDQIRALTSKRRRRLPAEAPELDFSVFLHHWGAVAASELSKPVLRHSDAVPCLWLLGLRGQRIQGHLYGGKSRSSHSLADGDQVGGPRVSAPPYLSTSMERWIIWNGRDALACLSRQRQKRRAPKDCLRRASFASLTMRILTQSGISERAGFR